MLSETVHNISPTWINRGKPCTQINIKKTEKKLGVVYIGDFCLKMPDGNWSEEPVSCFWQDILKDPSHNHYLGVFARDGAVWFTNASSIAEGVWQGAVANDGEIIYSRFRHDYRSSTDGTIIVDGGRDYFKRLGNIANPTVSLTIVQGKIVVNGCLFLRYTRQEVKEVEK